MRWPRPGWGFARLFLANVAIFLLLAVVLEGASSLLLFAERVLKARPIAERRHTRYDPELGWINEPNLRIHDMYGPGIYLMTNRQGFRGDREFGEDVPAGRRRVICAGDSVTFGYGVDDDHTWCRLLTGKDPRLETVNMAQGGYGVDQAYLWYKRDGGRLRHDIVILAPILDNFRRMQFDRFRGYGKPLLVLKDDVLSVTNVPVPRRPYYVPRLTQSLELLGTLRTVEALKRGVRALKSAPTSGGQAEDERNVRARRLLFGILDDLKRLSEERSSLLVLVFLPTLSDREPKTLRFWTAALEAKSQELRIPLISLVEDLDKLSDEEAASLYLPDRGHFNAEGNRRVASLIYEKLMSIPEVSRRLAGPGRR